MSYRSRIGKGIEWSRGTGEMRRSSWREPGYDCRRECKHENKGEHGWHCDEWIYVVGDANGALVLEVTSQQFADDERLSIEWRRRTRLPEGSNLRLHLAFPVEVESIRTADDGTACDFIGAECCFPGGYWALLAGELWERLSASPTLAQPETFWQGLETKYREIMADRLAERKDTTHAQCPTCKGAGVIAKVPS